MREITGKKKKKKKQRQKERQVMAEGRNQSYEDPHKHLRARRGARAMQVPGAGKKKEIPGNFLLCGMLVPSQKNDALWKKSKVARRAACPGTLLGIPANQ